MLDQTVRTAILTLREAGRGTRAIARALGISRTTVKGVINEGCAPPPPLPRVEKAAAVRDEIAELYARCEGNRSGLAHGRSPLRRIDVSPGAIGQTDGTRGRVPKHAGSRAVAVGVAPVGGAGPGEHGLGVRERALRDGDAHDRAELTRLLVVGAGEGRGVGVGDRAQGRDDEARAGGEERRREFRPTPRRRRWPPRPVDRAVANKDPGRRDVRVGHGLALLDGRIPYSFNCTTFAVQAVEATGHTAPSAAKWGLVALPNELYKDILPMKVDGDAGATTPRRRRDRDGAEAEQAMTPSNSTSTVRVIGRIASLRVMDVSKRAGVERLTSYVRLEVDRTEPDGVGDRIAGRELVHDGALDMEVGTAVEVETLLDSAGIGPLPIYRIGASRPEMG